MAWLPTKHYPNAPDLRSKLHRHFNQKKTRIR